MLTNYQVQFEGEIPAKHIAVGRNMPLAEGLEFHGDDLTGATFLAQIRTEPQATGAPLATIDVSIVSVLDRTIQSLIDDCTISASQVPCHLTPESVLRSSHLGFTAPLATIQALPENADPRKNSVLFWDLLILTPVRRTIAAGNFTVIPGVSR
jgi:hypothetical protein